MFRIISTNYIPEEVQDNFKQDFDFIMPSKEEGVFAKEQLQEKIRGSEGIFIMNGMKTNEELLHLADNLKVIGTNSVGFDHIDIDYASGRHLAVINTPQKVKNATAELTMTLILSITRGIVMYDRELRDTKVCRAADHMHRGMTLAGKSLGIIGMGSIGKEVARLASAFGLKIYYHNRHRLNPNEEEQYQAEYLSMDELMKQCDVISLNLPMTPENHHLINAERLSLMKPTAYIVNAARGPLIDEKALLEALETHKIAGAALDVFEFEPNISDEMAAVENIVIVPHIGTNLIEVRMDMMREALTGMRAYLNGEIPYNVVNK